MKFMLPLILLSLMPFPVFAQEVPKPEISAKQAYIMDFQTGATLYDKNGEERMPTSSMSKVLTAIVADDALRDGTVTKEQMVTVSEKAWKTEGSRMFLDINSQVSIDDLMHGIIIQSGNDACVALAEGIAGSTANFVIMMNKKAADIGMKNSHFMNVDGLPDPEHYSTAQDLALMAAYLIKAYPEEYKLYSQKEFTYNNIKQGNRNPLLYRKIGADGVKTGHTEVGGYGMIGSAVAGDRRVIVVINGTDSMQVRADESAKLTEWALTSFKNINLIDKGAMMAEASVVLSDTRKMKLLSSESYLATVPSFSKDAGKVIVTYKSPLVAPIKQGDVLGTASFALPDGSMKEVPLVAANDAEQSSFFKRLFEKLMILAVGVPE
ncbi:MAG: D-alanyl-D-alanine carboxypeptidase [Alphaproteobacteria bacterium]|nr:D-alanyl-D-alanine carboxypeptidase [Alphaproteobacteria bacterium]